MCDIETKETDREVKWESMDMDGSMAVNMLEIQLGNQFRVPPDFRC